MKKLLLCLVVALFATNAFAERKIDKNLQSNLVTADGKKFETKLSDKKYVIFYYSASWCGPCQKFTPELVKFYDEAKDKNFELIFVSADRSEKDMLGYMSHKKMSFPAIKFSKIAKSGAQELAGNSIPYLVMLDADGKKVVGESAWTALKKIEEAVKK